MASNTAMIHSGQSDLISIDQIKQMRDQIQQLLKEVMIEGIDNDYAVIPGTKKKSLLKPGAEKICSMFGFAVEPRAEAIYDGDDVTYRLTVGLTSPSGRYLGAGIGEASTRETKFAWREAVCVEEYEAAPASKRRQHWKKGYNGGDAICIFQVRENPADKSNNILKIAKKRSLIDAVLTVTGCSDMFTQDIEDDHGGEGAQPSNGSTPGKTQQAQKQPPADQGPIISPPQAGRFYGIWKNSGRNPGDVTLYLKNVCGVDDSRKMPKKFYDEACRWAGTKEPVPSPAAAATAAPAASEAHSEQDEANTAFSILGWDEKTRTRFIDQYGGDWKKILGELNILIVKKEGQAN
jgi:hypothetical protein